MMQDRLRLAPAAVLSAEAQQPWQRPHAPAPAGGIVTPTAAAQLHTRSQSAALTVFWPVMQGQQQQVLGKVRQAAPVAAAMAALRCTWLCGVDWNR